MNWTLFLLGLMEALLNPDFGPEQAITKLGEPTCKAPQQWQLQPRNVELARCTLYFENLEADKGLMTTIELQFKLPWKTTLEELERSLGRAHQWLPLPGPDRPRILQFRREGERLKGVLMLRVLPRPVGSEAEELTIPSALVRRFFPAPALLPDKKEEDAVSRAQ